MTPRRLAFCLSAVALWTVAAAVPAAAQPLGTFRWQMQPYCNVISVAVVQQGSQYQLDGTDDQCGAAQHASVTGLAFLNPNGSIGFGLSIVTAPGGRPVHVSATIALASLGGTWTDSAGVSGSFVFTPGAGTGGTPRPAPPNDNHSVGSSNVAVGPDALRSNTTGSSNTAVGLAAMDGNTTGRYNTAVGSNALPHNQTGEDNTAVGAGALFESNGGRNTAVGSQALRNNTAGGDNTAVGVSALKGNLTGGQSTGVGVDSLLASQTGRNTAIGAESLRTVISGSYNVAVGAEALYNALGTSNVSVGDASFQNLATGDSNTALGDFAGLFLTSGSNNLYLSNGGAASESNTTRIGGAQTRAFIAGVRGVTTGANNAIAVMIDSNGQLGTVSSSRRTKTDIEDLGAGVAFRLQSLRPVQFRYKQPFAGEGQPLQYGLIAEEVEAVMPELVAYNAQGEVETVKYHVLPSLLLAEVQRLERERAALTNQVADQAAAIAELRTLLDEMRARMR